MSNVRPTTVLLRLLARRSFSAVGSKHLCLAVIAAVGLSTGGRAETESIDLKALAKKARPAVMLLVVSDANGKEIATGTGFLVSSDGKLITNRHVIEGGVAVKASAEGKDDFQVVGILAEDTERDLVLLKIDGRDMAALPLGSSEGVDPGIRIVVVGSPLGLEGTLSEGIVSSVRQLLGKQRWLQITAPVSPGSSGSPVLNAKGEVIGIVTALLREGQALNFAVPVEVAKALLLRSGPMVKFDGKTVSRNRQEPDISQDEDYAAYVRARDREDFVEALKRIQSIISRFPQSAVAYVELGRIFSRMELFREDEMAAYQQALELNPDCAKAWYCLGVLLIHRGESKLAAQSFRRAVNAYKEHIKAHPDDADAWEGLGDVFWTDRYFGEASAAYQQFVKLNPKKPQAWKRLGEALAHTGRNAEAAAAYQQATELDPNDTEALVSLAWAYRWSDRIEKAWGVVSQLERVDSKKAKELADALPRLSQ